MRVRAACTPAGIATRTVACTAACIAARTVACTARAPHPVLHSGPARRAGTPGWAQTGAMATLPDLLDTSVLPLAVLHAARLDGHVCALGGGFLPVDLPETPEIRATAVAIGLPLPAQRRAELIAVDGTAEWILGARPSPPRCFELCEPPGSRAAIEPEPGYRVRFLTTGEYRELAPRARRIGPLRVLLPRAEPPECASPRSRMTGNGASAVRARAASRR